MLLTRKPAIRTPHPLCESTGAFAILGPLEVSKAGNRLRLGGPKQRTVLAHLILNANRIVSIDSLIDALWGDQPPGTARATTQTYVFRLRSILGADAIGWRSAGYVLHANVGDVDAFRFERLILQARRAPARSETARFRFGEALGLWRGPALADLAGEASLTGEIARLEEMRLQATEEKTEAELALGQHAQAVAELERLTQTHPLRERLWAHLMLAQYLSGRPAQALQVFDRVRALLADDLRVDPSPELRHLRQRILRQDPTLGPGGQY
jgi:DNA-binding SARP family transcriptional activator